MAADEDTVRTLVEGMKKRLEVIETYVSRSGSQVTWVESCKSTMNSCVSRLSQLLPSDEGQPLAIDRLEKISRGCGLRFDYDNSNASTPSCYISCDNFFLEVEMTSESTVREVKLGHGDDSQAHGFLRHLLATGRYAAFTRHLRGLCAIYDLPGPKDDRASIYSALCAVEDDLAAFSDTTRVQGTLASSILESPLGAVERRECGRLTCITFFISPSESLELVSTNAADIIGKVGVSGHVGVATTLGNHSLPAKPVQCVKEGRSDVTFVPLDATNSINVPCTFVFQLSESIAAPSSVAHSILEMTDMKDSVLTPSGALHNVLYNTVTKGSSVSQIRPKDSLHRHDVAVPSGMLAFFVRWNKKESGADENAVELQDINFTHPEQLVKVIQVLRRQLVYNALIKSCFAASPVFSQYSTVQIVDVDGDGISSLRATFEHPLSRNLGCVLINVALGGVISAKLELVEGDRCPCSEDVLVKIISTCLSLPVMMHSLRKRWQAE